MAQYHSINGTKVDAVQWNKEGDHPAVKRRDGIEAETPVGTMQTDDAFVCPGDRGDHEVQPGDWIITAPGERPYPIRNEVFLARYEAVE